MDLESALKTLLSADPIPLTEEHHRAQCCPRIGSLVVTCERAERGCTGIGKGFDRRPKPELRFGAMRERETRMGGRVARIEFDRCFERLHRFRNLRPCR